jgi:hypothetical protein
MTPDKARAARRMYDQRELTVRRPSDLLGVGRSSVYGALWRDGAVHGPSSGSTRTPDGPAAGRQG